MTKLKKDAWKDDGWERGDLIPGGNQGHTYLARRSSYPPGEFKYVLKTLKRQDQIDRLCDVLRRNSAMDVLDHPGVIRVVATNAEHFRENVELYLITTRIVGYDFEQLVEEQKPTLEEVVRVTVALLSILDHCHSRGVVHRDIKPCHVILREYSLDDPVLIDFGLAYHRDTQPKDAATQAGQGKGNRFLIGPEHLTRNPDANRSTVSDVCQCLGLLYYAVTNTYPGVLRDEQNRKPHERLSLDSLCPDIVSWKRNALLKVFDIGFEWQPANRWQTIDRLSSQLKHLLIDAVPSHDAFRLELADVVRRAKSESTTTKFQQAREIADELVDVVQSVVSTLATETQEFLSVRCGRSGAAWGETLAQIVISFDNTGIKLNPGPFLSSYGGQTMRQSTSQ